MAHDDGDPWGDESPEMQRALYEAEIERGYDDDFNRVAQKIGGYDWEFGTPAEVEMVEQLAERWIEAWAAHAKVLLEETLDEWG